VEKAEAQRDSFTTFSSNDFGHLVDMTVLRLLEDAQYENAIHFFS